MLEYDAEQEDAQNIGGRSQRWLVRMQVEKPAEHMRVPAQILKVLQSRVRIEEKEQEVARRAAVNTIGTGTEGRTDGVNRPRECCGEGVLEGGIAGEIHEGNWGTGRTSCATARAYC